MLIITDEYVFMNAIRCQCSGTLMLCKKIVKFGLSKKHRKICAIFLMLLTFTYKCTNFSVLLRKSDLYYFLAKHERSRTLTFFKLCVFLRKSQLYDQTYLNFDNSKNIKQKKRRKFSIDFP